MVVNNQCEYAAYAEETPANNSLAFDNIYSIEIVDDDLNNATDSYAHEHDDVVHYLNRNNGITYWFDITHTDVKVDVNSLNLNSVEPFVETCCFYEHILTVYTYETASYAVPLQKAEMVEIGSCKYAYIYGYDDRGNHISWYKRISDRVATPDSIVPFDPENPSPPPEPVDFGSDIMFLYNFGQGVINSAGGFNDLLNTNINGQSFISLLFSSGFIVYVGWCIFKWVIPL